MILAVNIVATMATKSLIKFNIGILVPGPALAILVAEARFGFGAPTGQSNIWTATIRHTTTVSLSHTNTPNETIPGKLKFQQ